MPTPLRCPSCEATLQVASPPAPGKRVRCPRCKEPFVVPGGGGAGAAVRPGKPGRGAGAAVPTRQPQRADPDDADDGEGPRAGRKRPREQGEEEAAPGLPRGNKKGGKKQGRGTSPVLLWGLAGGGAALLAGGVALVIVLTSGGQPPGPAPAGGGPAAPGGTRAGPGPAGPPEGARRQADELVALACTADGRSAVLKKGIELINALGKAQQKHLAVPGLVAGLRSEAAQERANSATLLGILGLPEPEVLEGLAANLRDPEGLARQEAAKGLRDIGIRAAGNEVPGAATAVPALVGVLDEEDGAYKTRGFAMQALGHFGAAAREAAPKLVALLGHKDAAARGGAANALARISGPAAEAAVPALRELEANDPSKEVRDQARFALSKLQKS